MTSPPYQKPEIEKIRKAQWSKENTAKTQAVVGKLSEAYEYMVFMGHERSKMAVAVKEAIERFQQLDPNVNK